MNQQIQQKLIELLPRLRRFAWGLAGSMDAADDLVQAACERAIGRMHQWKDGTRLDSWMFRIIQTIRIDELRSASVRERHLELVRNDATSTYAHDEGGIEGEVELEEMNRAMTSLNEDQRTALMLVCVEGYSYREAADIMDVPIGTVTSRVTRGRLSLLEQMATTDEKQESERNG